jgi:hypothetical protein
LDVAVIHRLVLFLGKLNRDPQRATWQELQNALSAKHPDLSTTKLHQIVVKSKNLFNVDNGQVSLCQLNSKFVRNYFELAENVEATQQMSNSLRLDSSSEPFQIGFGNSLLVSGLVCASSTNGEAVLFKFGGHTVHKLENPLPVNIIEDGQLARATLRIRKNIVNIIAQKISNIA